MNLINYKDIIDSHFCSIGFISILRDSHKEEDIQLFLSVATGKYTTDELSSITGLPSEVITATCLMFYNKYFKDDSNNMLTSSRLGWVDSGRHIYSPRMGSYKGY